MKRAAVLLLVLALTACGEAEPAPMQQIELSRPQTAPPSVMAESPDTSEASWLIDESGQSISFGNTGEPPLLSLACRLEQDPPQIAIIRHAAAQPGLTALFPVLGNGTRSRFLVDAVLSEGEWRWEGSLPADDPQLDVFTGARDITATLPGRGMLEIAGSRIPGEFVLWCRAGGQMLAVEAEEVDAAID